MLFSVNKGRDDLRDSLLIMSEEGNGNGGRQWRNDAIANDGEYIYVCVNMYAKVDVSGINIYIYICRLHMHIEDFISSHRICSFFFFFSNPFTATFISGPDRNRINGNRIRDNRSICVTLNPWTRGVVKPILQFNFVKDENSRRHLSLPRFVFSTSFRHLQISLLVRSEWTFSPGEPGVFVNRNALRRYERPSWHHVSSRRLAWSGIFRVKLVGRLLCISTGGSKRW